MKVSAIKSAFLTAVVAVLTVPIASGQSLRATPREDDKLGLVGTAVVVGGAAAVGAAVGAAAANNYNNNQQNQYNGGGGRL